MLRIAHHVQIVQHKFRRQNVPKFNGVSEDKTICARRECGLLVLQLSFYLQLFMLFTKALIILSL